jgi:tetratricopeptide (TPR) repeat protein
MGKKIAHTEILAKSNIGLGLVFDRIMQPQKSIPYYKEGIRLAERMEDDRIRLAGLVNLQSSFGMCYDENEQANYLDSVKYYCFKTLVLAKELHSKKEIIRTFVTLAGAYLSEKKYAQSLAYCDSVIAMADQKHNKSQLHSAYFKMAQCYIDMKAFQKSIDAANLSLQFADNNAKKANAIYRLFEANKLLGHFEKALYDHEQLKALDEEVLNNDRLKAVTELEQKYEKSKNEQTIKDLNQSSEIKSLRIKVLLFGIVLSILLILIIFFVFRQKAFKSKEIILEIEQRLTTLQGLAFKENDGKKMAEYLYKFSSLMRKTLESTFADYVTIEDELNFIDHYIELQLLKQKDTFEFHVDIAPDVDQSEVLIPSMIIQPFLENAIEHGFAAIDYKGLLHLSIRTSESELHVIISDNGKGIVETNNIQNKHISRAIQITKDRLYLISKGNKKKSSYFIKNREPHGVEIELVLPLLYEHPSISN